MPIVNDSIKVHDLVQVRLKPGSEHFFEWNDRLGYVVSRHGAGRVIVHAVDDKLLRLDTFVDVLHKIADSPVIPAVKAEPQFKYTIELKEHEYARLMQLVMKYGTGTGEGESTPGDLRIALANAAVSRV